MQGQGGAASSDMQLTRRRMKCPTWTKLVILVCARLQQLNCLSLVTTPLDRPNSSADERSATDATLR